jgi:hypothetical protein
MLLVRKKGHQPEGKTGLSTRCEKNSVQPHAVAARLPGVWLQESTMHKLLGFAILLHIKRKDLKMETAGDRL